MLREPLLEGADSAPAAAGHILCRAVNSSAIRAARAAADAVQHADILSKTFNAIAKDFNAKAKKERDD